MTRRLFGIAALPLTLLAGGCLPMRPFRSDSPSPPTPTASAASPYTPIQAPEILPAALAEPAAQPSPNPHKANPSTTNLNWLPLTTPPIIMITANEGSRHKAYAEYLGVIDYIRKPFAMERLLEAVEKGLNAPPPAEKTA